MKTLETLSLTNTNAQASQNPFVVQQIPELRSKITEGRNWEEIAEFQLENYFNRESEAADFELLAKFADIYSGKDVEALSEGFKCSNCFIPATQRCSRCKTVWYCSRECQIDHYKKEHKLTCKILSERLKEKNGQNPSGNTKNEILIQKTKIIQEEPEKNTQEQVDIQKAQKISPVIEVLSSTTHDEPFEASTNPNPTDNSTEIQTEMKDEPSVANKFEELD